MNTPLLIVLGAIVLMAGSGLAIMNNACKSNHHAWCAQMSDIRHPMSSIGQQCPPEQKSRCQACSRGDRPCNGTCLRVPGTGMLSGLAGSRYPRDRTSDVVPSGVNVQTLPTSNCLTALCITTLRNADISMSTCCRA